MGGVYNDSVRRQAPMGRLSLPFVPNTAPRRMKLVSTQLSYFFADPSVRTNTRALMKLVVLLLVVITVFAVVFHFVMAYEGQEHSWLTGVYWTLTVMSTLGFGDITFTSDLGRAFSLLVLVSGVVLLLIVLPFAFIRFFYAPWLEAQLQFKAPRAVPATMNGHLIICAHDTLTPGLIDRLIDTDVPYVVVEPDRAKAADLSNEDINVVTGEIDDPATYLALRAPHAAMVLANREDTVNTNITLTVREVAPDVPIVALVSADEAEDVLELSGATHVLPLKRQLGEHLANRVDGNHARTHGIGQYHDLQIAELPIRNTPFVGKTLLEARVREISGASVVGMWARGRFHAARPDLLLTADAVPVVVGTEAQLAALDELMLIYNVNPHPVLIIGGGRVARAAARALQRAGTHVNVVERDPIICERARNVGATVFEGDAADYALLDQAGIQTAPSVLLTTHDDAMNIFLAAYCRRLNPAIRIVSRITHDRNVESIHRAGADFVLSYASLGASAVFSLLQGNDLVVLGVGLDLFSVDVPRSLAGKTLAESRIGEKSGLLVVGIQAADQILSNPPPDTELPSGGELAMMGSPEQRHRFAEAFE